MNFLWSLLGALLPAAAGMLVLVIGAFCSLFSLDANSQMGPGIGLIFWRRLSAYLKGKSA